MSDREPTVRAMKVIAGAAHGAATALKNLAYESGVAHARKLARPVISVGNLALGGTGKTPVCIFLYRKLVEAGRHPSILLRGYSTGALSDEALLYRLKVDPDAVFVGPDRFASGRRAEGRGCDVHLLDDGFQHRQVQRECDVVLIDCSDPWQSASWLREGFSSLKRADILLLTRAGDSLSESLTRALDRIPLTPRFRVRFTPLSDLSGRTVFAFCGIGNPASFRRSIEEAGGTVAESATFRDHHEYTECELQGLRAAADRLHADLLLTTEKDAVRIPDQTREKLAIVSLPIETHVEDGFLKAVFEKIGGVR